MISPMLTVPISNQPATPCEMDRCIRERGGGGGGGEKKLNNGKINAGKIGTHARQHFSCIHRISRRWAQLYKKKTTERTYQIPQFVSARFQFVQSTSRSLGQFVLHSLDHRRHPVLESQRMTFLLG